MEPELLSPELSDFSIGAKRMGEAAFTLVNPKSKSDGSFMFKTSDTSVVSIKGNVVTIRNNGNCTITAVQLATTTFKRDSIKATFQISQKIGPVTSVFTLPEKKVGDAPFEIAGPVTNSNGAVSYTSSHPDVASIVGKTVYVKSAGKTVITWSQAESGTYRACTLSAELVVINPPVMENTVTDIDGNVYKTIKIGTQTWMMENLKVTRYRDGTAITLTTNGAAWSSSSFAAYCSYENKKENADIYGYLYNWEAAHNSKIAPAGWHVPSDAEWQVLYNYIGGRREDGAKIQQPGTNYWINNNIATNITMFTALPGGQRNESGVFSSLGWDGIWWTSTRTGGVPAICYDLYVKGYLERQEASKNSGFSIRCVKD
ncbi:fibrobacter succinogenes major paralogous domain-containing protein [Pedobacter africanus]|uniref:Uncharacterized protein (TIGR02145 family) n=1 Tax=Pedobacter africanus TaxID=151894 RepID=A0ACC6KRR8_9SPHI|nr:fibrobacter succinogenes major paralogous domain-containing protein [Pedobacter africanus]MDR6781859.1 uncharacterized protein (TIGR02145 family) [Pedobacter africanus]